MSTERLYGPLGRALREYTEDENYAFGGAAEDLDPFIDKAPLGDGSPEDDSVLRLALRLLARNYVERAYHSLHDAFVQCESPIERLMLAAIICYAGSNYTDVVVMTRRRELFLSAGNNTSEKLVITPQFISGDYRIDFLLEYEEIVPDFDNPITASDGSKIPGSRIGKARVLVECDGHDFHEKTKQQAARDKKRDGGMISGTAMRDIKAALARCPRR